MSANDLLVGELPSDSESDDSDYVSEAGSHSSSSDDVDMGDEKPLKKSKTYLDEIRQLRISKRFASLWEAEALKVQSEDHSGVLIDPLMLKFQQPQPVAPNQSRTLDNILHELAKYTNSVSSSAPVDVRRFKQLARSELQGSRACDLDQVARARAGLSNAQVEIEEEVRFAGQVVKMKKSVERTSQHAQRFERRRQRVAEEERSTMVGGDSLGSFQSYLKEIKNKRSVTSVEKSAAEWNQLKSTSEGMEQALKSDRGFLEKQAFLIRSSAKQDDIDRLARRKRLLESAPPPDM